MAKPAQSRHPRRSYKHLIFVVVLSIGSQALLRTFASAAPITNASATLSDSQPAQSSVSWTFNFSVTSATIVKSFTAQICATAVGACSTPSGFSANAASLASQPSGFGDAAGWVADSVTGSFRFKKPTNVAAPSGAQTVVFAGAVNPDTTGSYFARLTTYSDSAYTSSVDTSNLAFAIAPGVQVSAVIDPTLSFAVSGVPPATVYKGALATAPNCTDTATTVKFGTTAQPLVSDTDFDCAQTLTTSTNAQGGYQVTIKGQVPGDKLRLNSNPAITISDWSGTNSSPSPTPATPAEVFGYTTSSSTLSGMPNRFATSDNLFAGVSQTPGEVAYAGAPVSGDSVNVGLRLRFTGYTEAGTYSGTITYTCTATF